MVVVNLGVGFVLVRKFGKLFRVLVIVSYDLEYGFNLLLLYEDVVKFG